MEITIPEIVRIGGFDFCRILFSDLTEFFPKQRFNILFNCVENRLGVYYFFDESREVSYVGYTRKQSIKVRLNQYRTHRDSGNSFWQAYEKKILACHSMLISDHTSKASDSEQSLLTEQI